MTENKFHTEQKIIKEHNYAKNRGYNINKIMTNYDNEEKIVHVKDQDINIESKEIEQESNIIIGENKNTDSKFVNNVSEQESNIKTVDENNTLDDSLFGIGEKIYNHLKLILNDKQITVSNITYIIIELMQFIEHFHIENLSKKDVIVSILEKYVLENTDNVENIEHIKIFMNSIPNLIDIYKSIDTKKIKIKLKKFNCFFPLCG